MFYVECRNFVSGANFICELVEDLVPESKISEHVVYSSRRAVGCEADGVVGTSVLKAPNMFTSGYGEKGEAELWLVVTRCNEQVGIQKFIKCGFASAILRST